MSNDLLGPFPTLEELVLNYRQVSDQLIDLSFEEAPILKLRQQFELIASFASEYDFEDVPTNGLRSLLRSTLAMFESATVQKCPKYHFDDLTVLTSKLSDVFDLLIVQHTNPPINKHHNLFKFVKILEDHQLRDVIIKYPFVDSVITGSTPLFRQFAVRCLSLMIAAPHCLDLIKRFLNYDLALKTINDFYTHVKIEDSNYILNIIGWPLTRFFNNVFCRLRFWSQTMIKETIRVEVDSSYKFEITEDRVDLLKRKQPIKTFLNCRLLRTGCECSKKVLVYFRCGAFMGPKGDAYEDLYLVELSAKLPGHTLLCCDYSVGVDVQFPTALQEVLDFYLWLTSGDIEVRRRLGFDPIEFHVGGDSAGGNLASALCVALGDISTMEKVTLPKTLIAVYPVTRNHHELFPSTVLSVLNPAITMEMFFNILNVYVPRVKKSDSDSELEFLESPYLSPLVYEHFDRLSNVQLILVVANDDPLLDEGIQLAKLWRGPVKVLAMDKVLHGFLCFGHVSSVARQGIDETMKLIRKSMD